jgi:antitoxin ParD1/3/4
LQFLILAELSRNHGKSVQAHLQSARRASGLHRCQVYSGAYASGSEVIRAGLRALQERDAAVERWLRDEVAPVYDAMKANPDRKLSARSVFSEARACYAARRKARR